MAEEKKENVVFDANGKALDGVKSMTMDIVHKSRLLMSPMETGQQSLDYKVLDPKEVVVHGFVEIHDTDTLTKLDEMQASRDFKFFKVMSGAVVVGNLSLVQYRRRRDTNMVDMYNVELVYQEAMMIQSADRTTKSPDHSATASTGRVS